MSSSSQLCLVTGGGGFLATQIILLLVERGYRVRSCVRSAAKGAAWIKKQAETHPTISEHVEFAYVADMGVAGAYDRFAAITNPHLDPRPGHVYTEDDWNPSTWEEAVESKDLHFVYLASKTFAEKAVWQFVEDEKPSFAVTAIVPPVILGQAAQAFSSMADINQSSRVLWRLVDAAVMPGTPAYVCVDVQDCALAHVLAAEADVSVVKGKRYLTVGSSFTQSKAARAIAKLFPAVEHRLAKPVDDGEYYGYSSELVEKDLGIQWRPFEQTVRETFTQLLEVERASKQQ